MSCLCPISIPDVALRRFGVKKASLVVPCGHCAECARDRRNDWFVRLWSTYNRCKDLKIPVWFFTATIDQVLWPNLKKSCSGVEDRISPFVRSWNERFRYLNEGVMPLRFMCSEFGSEGREYIDHNGVCRVSTGALHFHGLLFGARLIDGQLVPLDLDIGAIGAGLAQTHGHVDFDPVRGPQAIRYTVKYATKDFSIENPKLRSRVFCSPGIGDPTFYFGDGPATAFVLINGFHYRTPRYFIDKQWSLLYGKDALFDAFGHNIFVEQRARLRFDALLDLQSCLMAEKKMDSSLREYLWYQREKNSKKPASLETVCNLIDLQLTGFSHPLFRYYEKRMLELERDELMSSDESFVSVKPYKPFIYHERNKTIFPLSLDFTS